MRKHLGAIIIVFILLFMIFSGCINNISEVDKFIGKWQTKDGLSIEFYNQRECKFIGGEGTWEIENGTILIVIRYTDGKNTFSYNYAFSEDNKILTLTDINDRAFVYTKQ